VDGDPLKIPNMLDIKEGRWLRRSDEVVIGPRLSRNKALRIGDAVRLGRRHFTVVGIGQLRGFGFASDSVAYLDLFALRQQAELGDLVNIIAVDTDRPQETRERILELGALSVTSPTELVDQAREVFAADMVGHWIVNLFTLAIAALFVNNMLARSVSERRLEFATLRAIGVPDRTILLTVALDAMVIAVVATALGIGLATVLGAWFNSYLAESVGIETLYAADAALYLQVFALALGLGLVAGLFPARQATRVDPVEVLRQA
jgi:putative ABC transport system permease protein